MNLSEKMGGIPGVPAVQPINFESFKASIMGDKKHFSIQSLREARRNGIITPEEYGLLLDVYVVDLEDTRENLEKVVGIDTLTGLSNLRFFEQTISELMSELNHPKESRESSLSGVVVVTIDMKGLKSFNAHGQDVGNEALRTFARRLKEVVKGNDRVFRVGGDEFSVVMSLDSIPDGFDFSKRLQEIQFDLESDLFINVEIDVNGGKEIKRLPLGAYMGYSMVRKGDTKNVEELIKESARDMASSKNNIKLEAGEKVIKAS